MTPAETSPPEPLSPTAVFRRFNRTYTRFIGTLNEGLLNTRFSLAEARVLYELATRAAPTAAEIAKDLALDSAYLSRILAKFKQAGLVRRKASRQDGRSSLLVLTARGKSEFNKLNTRSEKQASDILAALAPASASELIHSMQTIESILDRNPVVAAPLVLRPHRVGDMGWIVHREAIGYAQQFGWDATFEALAAKIVADFLTNYNPARERCWIAEIDGQPVGHVVLVQHPDDPSAAKLRLLFVESAARGRGVGHALVNECIRFARSVGYKQIVLWTQSILTAAHRIYQSHGFQLVKEEPHRSFGHHLIGQEWQLELT